jgi:chemotaxis protein MotB
MARRKLKHGHDEENQERWLLTYSDMITLLMALFMVLFSISSVNISKFRTLQQALREAFSGQILPGGKHLEQTGVSSASKEAPEQSAATTVLPFSVEAPLERVTEPQRGPKNIASEEQENFERIAREVKSYIIAHNLQSQAAVTIERKGLVITLLTDKLFFASGSAELQPPAYPLLEQIARLLQLESSQPIAVQGNTDSVPIDTPQYPSNWELSTARASRVVRFLIEKGVSPVRLSAVGFAEQRPIASNATAAGRQLNRRVEILVERRYQPSLP